MFCVVVTRLLTCDGAKICSTQRLDLESDRLEVSRGVVCSGTCGSPRAVVDSKVGLRREVGVKVWRHKDSA